MTSMKAFKGMLMDENKNRIFVIRFNGFVLLVFTENDDDSLAKAGEFF